MRCMGYARIHAPDREITFPLEPFIQPICGEVGYSAVRSRKRESFSEDFPHDTENNCNITYPIRLRYIRGKLGLGSRRRFQGR